jgi:hypothetical protein
MRFSRGASITRDGRGDLGAAMLGNGEDQSLSSKRNSRAAVCTSLGVAGRPFSLGAGKVSAVSWRHSRDKHSLMGRPNTSFLGGSGAFVGSGRAFSSPSGSKNLSSISTRLPPIELPPLPVASIDLFQLLPCFSPRANRRSSWTVVPSAARRSLRAAPLSTSSSLPPAGCSTRDSCDCCGWCCSSKMVGECTLFAKLPNGWSVDPLAPRLRFARSSCSDSIALRRASTSSLACTRDDTHVVSTGGTGGMISDIPNPDVCPADPRPPGLELLVDRLMRIPKDVDGAGTVTDLENNEWPLLRIDRPPGEGECSWLDASPLLVSSGLGELLSAGMVSRLIDEFPAAAELGVRTAPLDSVSIDEIEAPRERLAACGEEARGMRVSEGRPR